MEEGTLLIEPFDVMKVEPAESVEVDSGVTALSVDSSGQDDTLWLQDLVIPVEEDVPVANLSFGFGNFDLGVEELDCYVTCEIPPRESPQDASWRDKQVVDAERVVTAVGLRPSPHPELLQASRGKEKSRSDHNDKWSIRRVDQLRASLGWDLKTSFGDLPLEEIDDLLSNLFARVIKVSGEEYLASTLMNMLGGFNRVIRRKSDLRVLNGVKSPPLVGKDFNIKKHEQFVKTRLVLAATLKKTARDGTNKKTVKVEIMTEAMEEAILVDLDHQITYSQGCQKRLAFFLVVRCGIRGGKELHQLLRNDLAVGADSIGREYVRFTERHSKNNEYTIDRYAEHQFRKPYISFESDFVLCVKQYFHHMPPPDNCEPDLFLQSIPHPAGNIWFNRIHKVGRDKCKGVLRNMALLVGICLDVFSNKSGRATLITRMAARGVPDEVGMLLSGHHTADGYLRYDRSQVVKMEAAALVASDSSYNYQTALAEVSKQFIADKVVGNTADFKPLVALGMSYGSHAGSKVTSTEVVADSSDSRALTTLTQRVSGTAVAMSMIEEKTKLLEAQQITVCGKQQQFVAWHREYDQIDWDVEMKKDPVLLKALGGALYGSQVSVGSRIGNSLAGNNFHLGSNCTINFICGKNDDDKENVAVESCPK